MNPAITRTFSQAKEAVANWNGVRLGTPAWFGMALYMLAAFLVLSLGDAAIAATIPEDHYFENVGALSLFIASLLFFYCLVRSLQPGARQNVSWIKRLAYLGLAALFFFGAGEEISWGQRIFGLATPAPLEPANMQGELNIHNLRLFMGGQLLNMNTLFDLFWFLFAVLVPGLALLFPALRGSIRKLMPLLPWQLGALFLFDYLLAKLSRLLLEDRYTYARITLQQAVQEVKESNYSILFALAGLYAIWELKRSILGKGGSSGEPGPV